MKDKLEVGMYVRTKNGIIAKILNIKDEHAWCDNVLEKVPDEGYCFYEENSFNIDNEVDLDKIKKASYNIIDLIERFDLVNGHLVICKMYENEKDIPTIVKCVGDYYFKEEDIKSIVTKEQMEQMAYKVVSE